MLSATLVVYWPALGSSFIWDDDAFLTNNALIRSDAHLKVWIEQRPVRLRVDAKGLYAFWFSTQPPDYFPLTSSMLWVEWRLFGQDHPAGYHTVNVLLHALSAVLLWRLLLALQIPGAYLAALVFAVHPVNVESVAWITERKNVLPMVFYLLTLLAYLRFEERRSWPWYMGALLSFLLGLLAKTSIVMLPVILLGLIWWRRGRLQRQDLWRTAPFFALSLILGLVTVWYQTQRAIGTEVVHPEGFASRLAAAGWAVWFYLYKALLPINLCFVYPRWTVDPRNWLVWLPLLALVTLGATLIVYRRQGWAQTLLAALGYFVLMLLPVLGFVDIYFMRYSLVADHWQYFAMLGMIVLGAALWGKWQARQPIFAFVTAALIVLTLGVFAFHQSRTYANEESLWTDVLQKNPSCWLALNDLGLIYAHNERYDEAIECYRKAIELKSDYAAAHNNLGIVLQRFGHIDEAISHYTIASKLKPGDAEAHYNWGNALRSRGQWEKAIQHYELASKLDQNQAVSHHNWGSVLQSLGRFGEAADHYKLAIQRNPNVAESHNNLGVVLEVLGDFDGALTQFNEALRINPKYAEARNNWGEALNKLGQFQQAIFQFEQALQLDSANPGARNNWGNSLQGLERFDEAVGQYEEALRLKPDYVEAYNNLGVVRAKQGRIQEARAAFEQALRLDPNYKKARENLDQIQKVLRDNP
ncbi:MAG: tetratricopeptide repeat protein [Planctomycetes bacterium]|nr:tetratricopeptide repeat protein [Planctomycetota bacterium]